MVKIIRCASTNETQADYTSYFNEQITIKPNSKIALESMSVDLSQVENVVIPQNFNWKVQNALQDEERTCSIPSGNYASQTLLQNIKLTFNTTCNWRTDASGVNTEYNPFFDEDNKLNIQWLTNVQDSGTILLNKCLYDEDVFTLVPGALAEDDTLTYSTEVEDVTNVCITTKEMASLNSGGIKCRLLGNTTAGNVTEGFIIGLIKKDLIKASYDILPDDSNVLCCVYIDETGLIQVWQNGQRLQTQADINVQSGAGANNYTDIWIYKEGKTIKVYVQRQDSVQIVQLVRTVDQITPLGNYNWGFAGFNGVGTSITKFSYLPSPYINSNATGISIIQFNSQKQDIENYINYDNLGAPNQLPTAHTVVFSDIVKKIFGFKFNTYSQDATLGVFLAENAIPQLVYANNIFVEIPSLGLECFDSIRNGRRNIIKFIPNDKANTSHRKEYVSQFPVYVSIRNDKETFINSIQVRFLDENNQPLNVTGESASCEAILIIED